MININSYFEFTKTPTRFLSDTLATSMSESGKLCHGGLLRGRKCTVESGWRRVCGLCIAEKTIQVEPARCRVLSSPVGNGILYCVHACIAVAILDRVRRFESLLAFFICESISADAQPANPPPIIKTFINYLL